MVHATFSSSLWRRPFENPYEQLDVFHPFPKKFFEFLSTHTKRNFVQWQIVCLKRSLFENPQKSENLPRDEVSLFEDIFLEIIKSIMQYLMDSDAPVLTPN